MHRGSSRGAKLDVLRLGFAYDPHHPVLDEVDLRIRPGERVALVGPSGAGKTTLLELLLDLRTPTKGQIEFDGMDYRDIRIDALRAQTAFVHPNSVVDGTILENVRMGKYAIPLSEARRVLEQVGLWDVVSAFPDEMYRRLSPAGAPLSEGQVRKLLLARGMALQPRLFLIDEVLDQIPAEERQVVLDALFHADAGWTLIVATADPEIIARCDRVVHLAGHPPHEDAARAHAPNSIPAHAD
jgi:ABC-type multidrug transport system fused ATPase/permease subunit